MRVVAKTDRNHFELWVANKGERVPETAMQGEVRNSRNGLGLGLHIASQRAQAHRRRIDVTSTPEEPRFVFWMPLVQTDQDK